MTPAGITFLLPANRAPIAPAEVRHTSDNRCMQLGDDIDAACEIVLVLETHATTIALQFAWAKNAAIQGASQVA